MFDTLTLPTIVLDGGTGSLKVGYAGNDSPLFEIPACVGTPIMRAEEQKGQGQQMFDQTAVKQFMIGDEAVENRANLEVVYPMESGIIKDWDNMRRIWDYTFFEKLQLDPNTNHMRKIVLTEPPNNPLASRLEMCRIMMEVYKFGAVHIATQAVLVLYAQGLDTGTVLDMGDGVSHVITVKSSHVMDIKSLRVAGRDITRQLIALLLRRGYALNRTADFDTARIIKEKLCYISYDLELDHKLSEETTVLLENFTLPDGRTVRLGAERFEAPEILFQPHLIDVEQPGISELVFETIFNGPIDNRKELFKHIVLSGGTSMYPGLSSRLEKEMKQLWLTRVLKGNDEGLKTFKSTVHDPPNRKHLVFTGGSVFAGLHNYEAPSWITMTEFWEKGDKYRAMFTRV
ncbi:Arp2/3 complex subunit [Pyronema domesticum]|nr:Arp2/3 complex subunit [Pyronema domesticum]